MSGALMQSEERIFVLLRVDADGEQQDQSVIEYVTVKAAFLDERRAKAEMDRLNRLNAKKGCRYRIESARLDRSADPE